MRDEEIVTVRVEVNLPVRTLREYVEFGAADRLGPVDAFAYLVRSGVAMRWQVVPHTAPSVAVVATWRSEAGPLPAGGKAEIRVQDVTRIEPLGDSIVVTALGGVKHRLDGRTYSLSTEVSTPTRATSFERFVERVRRLFGN